VAQGPGGAWKKAKNRHPGRHKRKKWRKRKKAWQIGMFLVTDKGGRRAGGRSNSLREKTEDTKGQNKKGAEKYRKRKKRPEENP